MKKNNYSKRILTYIFFLILMVGCGQTGDLYLPEEVNNKIKKNENRV